MTCQLPRGARSESRVYVCWRTGRARETEATVRRNLLFVSIHVNAQITTRERLKNGKNNGDQKYYGIDAIETVAVELDVRGRYSTIGGSKI